MSGTAFLTLLIVVLCMYILWRKIQRIDAERVNRLAKKRNKKATRRLRAKAQAEGISKDQIDKIFG